MPHLNDHFDKIEVGSAGVFKKSVRLRGIRSSLGMPYAQGIETLVPSRKRNSAAGIMLALLSGMARSEVETLRVRINSGLAEARRRSVKLGRPQGTKLAPEALLQKHKDVVRLLKAGHSLRNTAKIAAKGRSTVQRVQSLLAPAPGTRSA